MRSSMKPVLYQDFPPTHADFLQNCISNHETISNRPSFRVIRALVATQSMFDKYTVEFNTLFLTLFPFFLSFSFYTSSVVFVFDM